jgi:hypothetical protein
LDEKTRECMLAELQRDLASGALYYGVNLSEAGKAAWPELLRQAVEGHDDDWLVQKLTDRRMMVTTGKYKAIMLAEGEFNRFYVRGLCVRTISEGGSEVVVCRAKSVSDPRSESRALIGKRISAAALLQDLRTAQGKIPALGIPGGPNSGITVRLAK